MRHGDATGPPTRVATPGAGGAEPEAVRLGFLPFRRRERPALVAVAAPSSPTVLDGPHRHDRPCRGSKKVAESTICERNLPKVEGPGGTWWWRHWQTVSRRSSSRWRARFSGPTGR